MYVSIRCHLQGVVPRRLWRFFLDTTHRGESAKQYYSGKWSNKKLRQLLIMNIHHIHCKRYVWDTLLFFCGTYIYSFACKSSATICLSPIYGCRSHVQDTTSTQRTASSCPRRVFLNLQHAAPSSKTKLSLSFHLSSSEVNRPKDLMF